MTIPACRDGRWILIAASVKVILPRSDAWSQASWLQAWECLRLNAFLEPENHKNQLFGLRKVFVWGIISGLTHQRELS